MKFLKVSGSYYGEFVTSRFDTGAATDADSTPTATATKNGTDDAGFSLTVTKIDTGRYKITGTVPAYSAGDNVQISVAATVNSVAGKGVVDEFVVVSALPGIDNIPTDVIKFGGTTVTGRDLGASVLISSGSAAGQLDVTSGVIKSNLAQILGTALTETSSGYLAASFKKLHDVVTPVLSNNAAGMAVIGESSLLIDWEAIVAAVPDFCLLNAARLIRNKHGPSVAGVLPVYEEDGITLAYEMDLTTSAAAEPVTSQTPHV